MDKLITTAAERLLNPEAAARDEWVRWHAAKLLPGSHILDVGAGASKYRPFFAHCRYETQDFCKYEGALVKYVEPITYVCDLSEIPLPDSSLDMLLCTEVFEHVPNPMDALEEFSRLLKPGGKLLLTAPFISWLHMEPFHYYGGFTPHWYAYWLPHFGFAIETITPVGGPGRSCVVFCQALNTSWSAAEARLAFFPRVISKFARVPLKTLSYQLLPRLLPRLDPWLGAQTVCSEYLVCALRSPDSVGID